MGNTILVLKVLLPSGVLSDVKGDGIKHIGLNLDLQNNLTIDHCQNMRLNIAIRKEKITCPQYACIIIE